MRRKAKGEAESSSGSEVPGLILCFPEHGEPFSGPIPELRNEHDMQITPPMFASAHPS